MCSFFWNGSEEHNKITLVAWDKICCPKSAGGVSLRQWMLMNLALGAKLVWNLYYKSDQKWARVILNKYLDSQDTTWIFSIMNPISDSTTWNSIYACTDIISNHITWDIGNGEKADFWSDSWEGFPALAAD